MPESNLHASELMRKQLAHGPTTSASDFFNEVRARSPAAAAAAESSAAVLNGRAHTIASAVLPTSSEFELLKKLHTSMDVLQLAHEELDSATFAWREE